MDLASSFFLFLFSTGIFFGISLVFSVGGVTFFVLPPILGYAFTALISHIFSQRKRMQALEKEVAELKEKVTAMEQKENKDPERK